MKKQTLIPFLFIFGSYLASTQAQNTKFGTYALFSNTTGFDNSAFGYESLKDNTTGYENSAFGDAALKNNTDGNNNAAFGNSALRNNSIGNSNAAFGFRTLHYNTTGGGNTGMGTWALISNTSGSSNTALGNSALWYNQTGNNNTAIGEWSLAGIYTANSASNNSAVGYRSLMTNKANDNNAFGYYALGLNTTGNGNAAFGSNGMASNVTGSFNAAFGNNALNKNTASYNNAFGHNAAFTNTTGTYNSAFGYNSLYFNNTGLSNTAIGNFALRYARYSYNVGLGAFAGNDSDYSNECTYVGYNANNDSYLHLFANSTAIGNASRMTASNQVTLGNSSITTIGGFANWTNFSDGRFKKEVTENVPGLEFIKKLRPVTYHLDVNGLADYLHEDVVDSRDEKNQATVSENTIKARNEKEKQLETGFIAQEVEAAANELGYEFSGVDKPQNETDLYGLRYAAFTVPLVKAVQELDLENVALQAKYTVLQRQNDRLMQQNADILLRLENMEKLLTARSFVKNEMLMEPAALKQNTPNPFHQNTAIQVFIPEEATHASLIITNENGSIVKEMNISDKGVVTMTLSAGSLSAGVYYYTLFVDGKTVDTKKMILTK
jgi:hypothetical protein